MMQRTVLLLTCALLCWLQQAAVQAGQNDDEKKPAVPDYYYDPADEAVEATVLENPLWYDADVLSHNDALWYAWLEFTTGEGDQIWVGARDGEAWTSKQRVTDRHGEYARPTLTADSAGQLWLSYEARQGDQWDVFVVPLRDGRPLAEARRVSPGSGADIHHAVAADRHGGLWFVWQSDRQGQFDVVARRVGQEETGEVVAVGEHPAGDWHPSVAVDGENVVYVAWDAYDGGAFNVVMRINRDGRWGDAFEVARSHAFEGRAQLAAHPRSGAYLAWEVGGENWGKPFRGLLTPLLRDHRGPLHRFRYLQVAVVEKNGMVSVPLNPLPMPSFARAAKRMGAREDARRLGVFYERPRLCVDHQDHLWVAYRHFYTPWLGIAHRSHIEEGWGVYARQLQGDAWSPLFRMSVGQGDGMQRLELAAHADGVQAVWTTGRTHRTTNQRPRGIVTAGIQTNHAPAPLKLRTGLGIDARPVFRDIHPPRKPPVRVGEKQYQLYYGDLHRHTDLSLCRVPIDGTIDDAYRYATEVARLDFLGITDHTRDIALGDPLSQLWWRCRKEVYRHQLGAANEMTFVPFYAYERSHGNTADHNVISLRPDMLRPYTYPVPEFWKELDRDTMTIPHQPIRRDTWNYQNDELRPLLEIFQGARDRAITEDAHRGLAKGYHLGFIASSDHMSTSSSYACVWAEEASREAIFRALQARRTFGATAKIRLLVRAGDHWMGEIIKAERMPEVELVADGTAPIRSVNLVLDGKTLETHSPNNLHVRLRRELDLRGPHYLYFHLVQADGNEAWSSPLWVDIAPAAAP